MIGSNDWIYWLYLTEKVLSLPDLNAVLERLINNLNGEVKDIINQSNLAKLIAIYTTIMQTQQKQKHRSLLPQAMTTSNTADLVQEVIQLLQEEVSLSLHSIFIR